MKKFVSVLLCVTMLFMFMHASAVVLEGGKGYESIFDAEYTSWTYSSGTQSCTFKNSANTSNYIRFNAAGFWSGLGSKDKYPEPSTTPQCINLSDAPASVASGSGISSKIVKIEQTANISMARMYGALSTPLAAGDKVKVSFKVYLADIYEKAANYDADGTTVIPAVKDEDNSITSLSMRIIPYTTADANYWKTVNVPVNKWHTVEAELTLSAAGVTGFRFDFGANASAQTSTGYTTPFAGSIYVDGNFKIEKEVELDVVRSDKSSWKELSLIDFEENDDAAGVTSENGEVTVLNTLVSQYPESEVGTRGLNVYKFSMDDTSSSVFSIEDFYDNTILEEGDTISVSAYIFAADIVGENPSVEMLVTDLEGTSISTHHSTGELKLKPNKWTKIGCTFTYTGNEKVLKIKATSSDYFNTLLIDDIKTAVYAPTGMVPSDYDYTDDIDSFNSYESPYIKSPKFRAFGSGDYKVDMCKNGYSNGKAYSNGTSMMLTNRNYSDMGMKINDIFQGVPNEDDIGRKFRISAYVYADKESGVYQGNKNRVEFTDEMLAQTTGTVFKISLAGPDGSNYKYRTGGYNGKSFVVPWNVWTKIEFEYTITEAFLDNGSTDSLVNPLINAVRIDQSGADGSVNAGVVNTFYVDDFKVKEVGEAPVTLAKCFAGNMVLQRNAPIKIWGESTQSGINVTVKLGDNQKTTTTTESGKWSVTFDAMSAQTGLDMTFSFDGADAETTEYKNIAIGDVILAAGQSNMALSYGSISNDVSDIEADSQTLKNIRALKMSGIGSFDELADNESYVWISAESSLRNSVSAIGLITAYNIAKEQNVPVGIINASLGGARIEAFLSRDVLESRDIYADYIKDFEALKAGTKEFSRWQYIPTAIYNYMLAPLKGMSISSCVWYQGCNNRDTDSGDIYETKQQDLVKMFREYFNNPDMPVAVCQLAPYSDNLYDNQIVHIRQNQLSAAKRQEGVYLIPTCDVGPVNSDKDGTGLIHPSNKRPVAERCYLAIKHHNYGYDGEYSGPQFEYMTVDGSNAVLHFSHADGLKIKANNSETFVTGFEISGDGKNFVKADAMINGNTITVSADGVTTPKEVRYCYTSWTYYDADGTLKSGKGFSLSSHTLTGNLGGNVFNSSDLPLAPFKATVAKPEIISVITSDNKCEATISNSGTSSLCGLALFAVYSGDTLYDVKIANVTFETSDTKTYTADITDIPDGAEVKVMLFDNERNIVPLCVSKTN